MQCVRSLDSLKRPGVSETLEWARALVAMERRALGIDIVRETTGCILKYQDDITRLREELVPKLIATAPFPGNAPKQQEPPLRQSGNPSLPLSGNTAGKEVKYRLQCIVRAAPRSYRRMQSNLKEGVNL